MTHREHPILLTPGPLTTSRRTKEAMLRDWGSWDADFNQITGRIRERLVKIIHGEGAHGGVPTHECVPLQGSGTFAVEAAIGTLVPKHGHVLVPVNGAYCQRIAKICKVIGRRFSTLEYAESAQIRAEDIDLRLGQDPSVTHVALVHCETGTGILNPLAEIAQAVSRHGKGMIVDAMSSIGAIEIDARASPIDAVIGASGKCLEGVPGMGFILIRRAALEKCEGNAHSLAMDLYDQWAYMGKTTQWRFTPPTHVVAALDEALRQFEEEGGVAARGLRYAKNCEQLVSGMQALGFTSFLSSAVQAPIIVTFHAPADPAYEFRRFYQEVKNRGYILYPGKLTQVETFRVGCIGHFGPDEMNGAVAAISGAIKAMGITEASLRASPRPQTRSRP